MNNIFLDRLLATGKAHMGTFIVAAPVALLPVPPKSVVVITDIKFKHFADLRNGELFSTGPGTVATHLWHQLHVYSKKGSSFFSVRGDLRTVFTNSAAATFTIPCGETNFQTYLTHIEDIRIEISKINLSRSSNSLSTIPSKGVPFNNPPAGYGKTPNGITTVTTVRDNTAGEEWQYAGLGDIIPQATPAHRKVQSFIQPIFLGFTNLNPAQYTIPFGNLTAPCVNITYVVIHKIEDLTVDGSF